MINSKKIIIEILCSNSDINYVCKESRVTQEDGHMLSKKKIVHVYNSIF